MDNQNNNNDNNNNMNQNDLINLLNSLLNQNNLINFIPDDPNNKLIFSNNENNGNQQNILNELDSLLSQFPLIFNIENDQLIKFLKSKNIPLNLVCAKMLDNQGAVYCEQCGKQDNCIICFECYENSKELHKGHNIVLKTNTNGCCDCGNPDAWDKDHFCPNHKGFFKNEEDLNNYIEKCFDKNTINEINIFFDNLHYLLNPYFLKCEDEKRIKNNNLLYQILETYLNFIEEISEANYAI